MPARCRCRRWRQRPNHIWRQAQQRHPPQAHRHTVCCCQCNVSYWWHVRASQCSARRCSDRCIFARQRSAHRAAGAAGGTDACEHRVAAALDAPNARLHARRVIMIPLKHSRSPACGPRVHPFALNSVKLLGQMSPARGQADADEYHLPLRVGEGWGGRLPDRRLLGAAGDVTGGEAPSSWSNPRCTSMQAGSTTMGNDSATRWPRRQRSRWRPGTRKCTSTACTEQKAGRQGLADTLHDQEIRARGGTTAKQHAVGNASTGACSCRHDDETAGRDGEWKAALHACVHGRARTRLWLRQASRGRRDGHDASPLACLSAWGTACAAWARRAGDATKTRTGIALCCDPARTWGVR